MKISTKPFVLIGILIFIYIVATTGAEKILGSMLSANPIYIMASLPVLLLVVFMKTYRWQLIVKTQGVDYGLWKAMRVWLIGLSASMFTPGKSGDIIRSWYLQKETGLGLGRSASTVVLDRMMDIAALFFLSLYGVYVIGAEFSGAHIDTISVAAAIAVLTTLMFVVIDEKRMRALLRPFYSMLVPKSLKEKTKLAFTKLYAGFYLARQHKGKMALSLILSVFGWLLSATILYLLSLSLGIGVDYRFIVAFMPFTVLASLLPITVSGLGTREAAFLFLFSLIGVSADAVVSLSLLNLFVANWAVALVGFVLWTRNKVEIKI